ncbi:MAG: thiolase family protein [Verrucomicrobiaceae bacterium]|nr:thiolase family protein [Verrucomicrobiaceae bacterium]
MKTPALYIIDGTRTPFCRMGSSLASQTAVDLGKNAITNLLTRTGIDPAEVDEVILGCVGQPPEAQNVARVVALRAGLPERVPAMTVHRNCASGMEAVFTAHQRLCAGHGEIFIVGGTESMSNTPFYFSRPAAEKFTTLSRARTFGTKARAAVAFRPADFAPVVGLKLGLTDPYSQLNMGETAEVLAREFSISREAQDAFAARSQLLANSASHIHQAEISPYYLQDSATGFINTDNGIRADATAEKLAKLKPVFDPKWGSVTAGNSSQITDGAAALLVAGEDAVRRHGWEPIARLVDYAVTGCDPKRMGLGPVRAMDAVLHRTGFTLADMDLFEINEAFAAQVLAVMKCVKDPAAARAAGLDSPLGEIPTEKLNLAGGAIALGHPVGATGARLILTAIRQLQQRDAHRALVSLCIGGGQGAAACIELC